MFGVCRVCVMGEQAPVVDSVYVKRFGRRKSWVVPMQLLVGGVLIALSSSLELLLASDPPKILVLTAGVFLLDFMVATQDIAVDGWALTLLRCVLLHSGQVTEMHAWAVPGSDSVLVACVFSECCVCMCVCVRVCPCVSVCGCACIEYE